MPAGEPSRPSSARSRKLARMVALLVLAYAITLAALPVAADGEGTTTTGAVGAQTAGAEGVTAAGKWTQPAILSSCPGTGAPHVVFPSDSPTM